MLSLPDPHSWCTWSDPEPVTASSTGQQSWRIYQGQRTLRTCSPELCVCRVPCVAAVCGCGVLTGSRVAPSAVRDGKAEVGRCRPRTRCGTSARTTHSSDWRANGASCRATTTRPAAARAFACGVRPAAVAPGACATPSGTFGHPGRACCCHDACTGRTFCVCGAPGGPCGGFSGSSIRCLVCGH